MIDVKLLPLYAELQGYPKLEIIKHYARACVEANTEALRAENKRLAEALRPFVALYQPDDVGHMDRRQFDAQGIFGVNGAAVTPGDLRRAYAALNPTAAQEIQS